MKKGQVKHSIQGIQSFSPVTDQNYDILEHNKDENLAFFAYSSHAITKLDRHLDVKCSAKDETNQIHAFDQLLQ